MLELHITAETLQKMCTTVDTHLAGNVIDDKLANMLHRSIMLAGPYSGIVTSMWKAVSDHNFELYGR
jgi:hypothetical protein